METEGEGRETKILIEMGILMGCRGKGEGEHARRAPTLHKGANQVSFERIYFSHVATHFMLLALLEIHRQAKLSDGSLIT